MDLILTYAISHQIDKFRLLCGVLLYAILYILTEISTIY